MKIIVIGAAGFIGTGLSLAACAAGHTVIGIDCAARPQNALDGVQGFSYYNQPEQNLIAGADGMVILAAKRSSASFSIEDYFDNLRLAHAYFTLAKENGIKNVVFASSKAVYSGDGTPWREQDAGVPLSLYGASKAAAEQLSLYENSTSGMAIKCLRFAQVIGSGERKGYLINTLIDNAIQKRTQTIYGSGDQRRQYIYESDVHSAILFALEKPDVSGLFNIGMPGTISNLEMAECVNKVFENDGNLVHDYSREMGQTCDEMDVTKARRVLGYSTRFDLLAAFEDIRRRVLG